MNIRITILKNGEIHQFTRDINDKNFMIIKKKLQEERQQIINVLKTLKEEGKIKCLNRPINKKTNRELKEQLQNMIAAKKEILSTIKKINILFYN